MLIAVVATKAIHAAVYIATVEVPPPAVGAVAALGMHVSRRGEAVVRRSIATTAATVPVKAMTEAAAVTIARVTRAVKTTQIVLNAIKNFDKAACLYLEILVAL